MAYRHGVYMSEIPSTVKAPIESDAGVIVVVGTAPVNMADDPYHTTNVPLLVHTMAEAKSAVGYSTGSIWTAPPPVRRSTPMCSSRKRSRHSIRRTVRQFGAARKLAM